MRQTLILFLVCGLAVFSVLGTASAHTPGAEPSSMIHVCDPCDAEARTAMQMDHGPACAFMPGCLITAEPAGIEAPVFATPMQLITYHEVPSLSCSRSSALNPPPPRS